MLSSPLFNLLLLHTLLATTSVHAWCASNLDCSLNGDCSKSSLVPACVCDHGWKGSRCDQLDLKPLNVSSSGYRNSSGWNSWGGNSIYDPDTNKYHLFVAQIDGYGCTLDQWGSNSMIVRAESDEQGGPYRYAETVVMPFAHNPTIRRDPKTGAYVLFMIGHGGGAHAAPCKNKTTSSRSLQSTSSMSLSKPTSASTNNETTFTASIYVSSASSILGPWTKPELVTFSGTSEMLGHGRSNPSPHFEEDGSVLLAFVSSPDKKSKGPLKEYPGMARSPPRADGKPAWLGPFELVSAAPILPPHFWCIAGTGEDPFLWRDRRGLKALIHGMCPTGVGQAHFAYSDDDGKTWHSSADQAYSYNVEIDQGEGRPTTHKLYSRVERPQLAFDQSGSPSFLFNGVCEGFGCLNLFGGKAGPTYTIARRIR